MELRSVIALYFAVAGGDPCPDLATPGPVACDRRPASRPGMRDAQNRFDVDMSDASSPGPAAARVLPGHFPPSPVEAGHTAPCPRRIRAVLAGRTVLDTTRAVYVWEHPHYPRYAIPVADVRTDLLGGAGEEIAGLAGHVAVGWDAMDAWYEEDEEVFVHPRSPYTRVEALRTTRHVRVARDGVLLAEAGSAVAVFETGLPTRWYLDPTAVEWPHLEPSGTVTRCPYKGTTSGYWHVVTPAGTYEDLAWSYAFPTRQLTPIAGLVCFYDEHVELTVDGLRTAADAP